MIIQFSVENFRSIMEPATLSLVASPLKDVRVATEDVIFDIDGMDVSLLKSAVILGANASGKSNVIKALEFFKSYIIDSFKNLQAGEEIGVEAFKLNTDSAKAPSSFEMILILDGYQYRYGMDVSRESVHGEWLYRKACRKRAKEVELFYRDGESMKVHPSFSIATDLVNKKMIRNNALLLSAAAQFNDPTAVQIINWLTDTSILTCSDEERMWNMAVNHLDDAEMPYPIIKALDNGSRLVIDEFDSKLHPVLTNRIISLFNSRESNPRNAQLIFTAHDTNILSSGLFRRDQIWFTQKNRFGATSLYSLSDYKVRSDAPFEKDYLSGKYGATPVIGNLESVLRRAE